MLADLGLALLESENNRFIHHSIAEDTFKRIYSRYEEELSNINTQIINLEEDHSDKVQILQKVMALAQNIGQAYKEAEPPLKRIYLELFWEGFDIKNGKIARSRLHKDLKYLVFNSSSSSKTMWAP